MIKSTPVHTPAFEFFKMTVSGMKRSMEMEVDSVEDAFTSETGSSVISAIEECVSLFLDIVVIHSLFLSIIVWDT